MSDATPAGPLAAIAVQRGDRLMFRLFHDGSVKPEDCTLRLFFAFKGKTNLEPVAPADATALDQSEALIRSDRDAVQPPRQSIDFEFVTPERLAVMASVIKVRQGETFATAPFIDGHSLGVRIPRNRTEFRHYLAFRHFRHVDIETVYRAGVDILKVYGQAPKQDPLLAPYIVNAYVVATYKAIEMGLPVSETRRYAAQIDALLARMAPSSSMRDDCDIAVLSVHSANWHYAVHTGDDALLDEALAGVEAVSRLEREQPFTFVYNACKGLIFYALLKSFESRKEAYQLFYLVYSRFRTAVAIHTHNAGWFKELTVPLSCSVVALQARPIIKSGEALPKAMVTQIANLAPRVVTPAFKKRMTDLIARRRKALGPRVKVARKARKPKRAV